jgi:Fe-S-cluster containining protein
VYLTEEDLERAAAYVGTSAADFERRYVYRTRHLRRLRIGRRKHCPFLLEGGCSIHPAKPTQCRLFPFWPELVETQKNWQRVGRYCPGIGTGKLVQIGTAVEIASEMKQAYPTLYQEPR